MVLAPSFFYGGWICLFTCLTGRDIDEAMPTDENTENHEKSKESSKEPSSEVEVVNVSDVIVNKMLGRFQAYRGMVLLALGALVVWMNATFLIPLTMGAIFAIVLYPLMNLLSFWRLGRSWKALIVTTVFAVSFLLPLGTIILLGAEEALTRLHQAQQTGGGGIAILSPSAIIESLGLEALLKRFAEFSSVSESQILQLATRAMSGVGVWVARLLQGLVSSVPKAGFSIFITLIAIFFFLVDGRRALQFIRENSFFGSDETERVLRSVASLCYSVVVASVAAGAVQAVLIALACVVTGTPKALLIGLIAFVLSFLPLFGTLPVTLGLTLQALVAGDVISAVIFAVSIALVGASDNVVRPWVLRGGASLHPLVGFVAAFGALDSIGFYGVFIGPVVAGLFFTLLPMVAKSYQTNPQL